jgi:hypothetical protein
MPHSEQITAKLIPPCMRAYRSLAMALPAYFSTQPLYIIVFV